MVDWWGGSVGPSGGICPVCVALCTGKLDGMTKVACKKKELEEVQFPWNTSRQLSLYKNTTYFTRLATDALIRLNACGCVSSAVRPLPQGQAL